MKPATTYTMLCLGDSYTIGEAVDEKDRFANQAIDLLKSEGIHFTAPHIIAKTGWTTDELSEAINANKPTGTFSFVTLLIGVNNQYRGRDTTNYRAEFKALLNTALSYARRQPERVFVISIPDWGVTPFVAQDGKQRTAEQIALEIDAFNTINREEALQAGVHYIDITEASRKAATQPELIATDGLHPSGLMYKEWAIELAKGIKAQLN